MSQIEVRATTNQISIRKASNNIIVTTSRPVINSSILKNEVTASIGTPKNLIIATPVSVAVAVLGNLDGGSAPSNYIIVDGDVAQLNSDILYTKLE